MRAGEREGWKGTVQFLHCVHFALTLPPESPAVIGPPAASVDGAISTVLEIVK